MPTILFQVSRWANVGTSKYGQTKTILAANNCTCSSFSELERKHPPQNSDTYSRLGLMKDVYRRDSALDRPQNTIYDNLRSSTAFKIQS